MIIYCWDAGVLSVIYQWGSVYFRIPRADLEVVVICSVDLWWWWWWCICLPFISEPVGRIGGCMFPQMVVISSKIRGFCTFDDQGTWRMAMHCIHSSTSFSLCIHLHSNSRLAIWGVWWIENLVERYLECQNVIGEILSVSMKPESKGRIFLIWIDVAFMHTNPFAIL